MEKMIQGYKTSCELVKKRVRELRAQRKFLLETGKNSAIEELDLERRIKLLYTEYEEMKEIINHLESYEKWIARGERYCQKERATTKQAREK